MFLNIKYVTAKKDFSKLSIRTVPPPHLGSLLGGVLQDNNNESVFTCYEYFVFSRQLYIKYLVLYTIYVLLSVSNFRIVFILLCFKFVYFIQYKIFLDLHLNPNSVYIDCSYN